MANAQRRTLILLGARASAAAGLSCLTASQWAWANTVGKGATDAIGGPHGRGMPIGAPVADAERDAPPLDSDQSARFRAWFVLLVSEQLRRGPNPRWYHRDCAGLVRFAVDETLRPHDYAWRKANGLTTRRLPPPLLLTPAQAAWRQRWTRLDGTQGAFVTASALVQENSVLVSRDINMARPGDLLFYDQGDDQHLMIWMGDYIAYHNGTRRENDTGLRAVGVQQLLTWSDVRWQPRIDNPNFIGVFRLRYLTR